MDAHKISTTCPYCGTGCGLWATVLPNGGVKVQGDKQHPANFGRICSKGAALGETVNLEGRLLYPEIRGQRVNWDTALDTVAQGFGQVIAKHGAEAVAFYVSGQLLTEDYYVANKLMKGFIGSANIDTNSRLCMASSVAGHKRAFGADIVPGCYEDLELADLVVLVGTNLAWCHPVLYQRIAAAKQQNSKMRVVVIDPRRTATCDIADLHLALRSGTDVVLFNGLLDFLRRNDRLDFEFIEAHTQGLGAALAGARDSAGGIPQVARACDLEEAQVAEFYRLFAATEKTLSIYSQGVNQSSSGTDKVNSIINCHLASGRIGKPGMGPFSVTGQPNAMGGREVGALANQLVAHMDFAADEVARVKRFWNAPAIADKPGLKAVDLFEAIRHGRVKALWIMATNPVVSLPNARAVRAALAACEFVVVSDNVANTDTSAFAHVKLPAQAWGEKSGTVTNSERRISRQRAFLPTPGEARADWWIVSEVAKRMGFAEAFDYASPAAIFREYAALSAYENQGSRDFDLSGLQALSESEYESLLPLQWPYVNGAAKPRFFADGRFYTANGKAQFIATSPRPPQHLPDAEYDLVLNTGRLRDQWHTMTRTGKTARLLTHVGEPRLSLHPQDASRLGIQDKQLALVQSTLGEVVLRVTIDDSQRRGEAFAPFHWSRQFAAQANLGELIHPSTDPVSGQPEFKHTPIKVCAWQTAWQGFVLARAELALEVPFFTKIPGTHALRYEIAGTQLPDDWRSWLHTVLGDGDWLEYRDSANHQYRCAVLRNGRLHACAFIAADYPSLPPREGVAGLFSQPVLNAQERLSLLTGKPVSQTEDAGATVCSCFNVGQKTLQRAILEQQLCSLEAIGAALKAGTNCGSCIPELKALLQKHGINAERNYESHVGG